MSFVVIGGGLAGISAALTLQDAGESVELYEAADDLGGRVRSDYVDGYILDRGFQLINDGYPELKRLKVIGEIDFQRMSRSIDVMTPFGLTSIGDPRLHPLQALTSPLGSFGEKFAFLRFLFSRAGADISLRDSLLAHGAGDFYSNLIEPFLKGVFLTPLEHVDSGYAQEIIKGFLQGSSGLPNAGVGALTSALGARIESVYLNSEIEDLAQFAGRKIVVATDAYTAAKLLNLPAPAQQAGSVTWYHRLPSGLVTSDRLRVASVSSHIVNSIAISNALPSYAPEGCTLISSTSCDSISDGQAQDEISKFWQVSPSECELISRYEIPHSLPIFSSSRRRIESTLVEEKIAIAGDYLTAGSQNGALLSGRLAANELLAH